MSRFLMLLVLLTTMGTAATAQTGESFEAFCARMKQAYGIEIFNYRGTPVTQQEQVYLEEGFRFWGADVCRTISAYYSVTDKIRYSPVQIVLKPDEELYGKVSHNIVYLYGSKWDQITVIHEITHVVHNVWFEIGPQGLRKEMEAQLVQCNDGKAYGSPWVSGDQNYYAWAHGKSKFSDDMATLMPLLYNDKKFADKIKDGQLPAMKKKLSIMRDYVVNYIAPTSAFDTVLEPVPPSKDALLIVPKVTDIVLEKNKTFQVETGYTFPRGSSGAVEYSSNNPGVATVDQNGLITLVGPGKAAIKIKTIKTGNTSICIVSDTVLAKTYTFNVTQATIDQGGTFHLTVTMKPDGGTGTMIYRSDNVNVATVDQNGRITGKSAGTAKISAELTNGFGAFIAVPFVITVTTAAPESKAAEEKKRDDASKGAAEKNKTDGVKIKGLAIKSMPVRTTYKAGESFDPTGLTAVYLFSNGSTSAALSPVTLRFTDRKKKVLKKGDILREAGTIEVTVACGEYAAGFNIVVTAAAQKNYAGMYKIFAAGSRKQCIGVRQSNMANGAEVIMAPSLKIADQQFIFEKAGDKYRIRASHSGKYLTVDGQQKDGAYITQSDAVIDDSQLFEIIDCGNGTVKLKTGRGYFVTPKDGSIKTLSRLVIWKENSGYNQQFKLTAQ